MGFLFMRLNTQTHTHIVLWEIIGSENTHLSLHSSLKSPDSLARSRNFRQQDGFRCCLPISVCCLWRQHVLGFRDRQRGSRKKLRSSGLHLLHCAEDYPSQVWKHGFLFLKRSPVVIFSLYLKNPYRPVCSWWFSLSLDFDVAFFSAALAHMVLPCVFHGCISPGSSPDTWRFVSHRKWR